MTKPVDTRSERYLRYSHQSMIATLFLVIAIGGGYLLATFNPAVAGWMDRTSWALPVAIALVVSVLQAPLRGDRWNPKAPEAQAILGDEWRRTNMDRARRVAFVVVLCAQVPLGLLLTLADIPSLRALMVMAVSTMTLGMTTLIVLFLFFNREQYDG